MKSVICSIYYPHKHLQRIIRECLFSLVMDLKENYSSWLLNYHLSTYKGENISFEFDCQEVAQRDIIFEIMNRNVKEYFKNHPAVQPELKFPLNQLFLNVPSHTIHFWENSPFRVRIFLASNPETDRRIKSLIAGQCLHHFSASDKYFTETLFIFYIQLYIIFNKISKDGNKSKVSNIAIHVLKRIKDLKKDSIDAISLLENNFTQFYFQNKEAQDKEILMIIKQLEYPEEENVNISLQCWKSLIEEIDKISAIDNIPGKEMFYTNLLLDISQKFSLQVDDLIKAAVVLREFYCNYL